MGRIRVNQSDIKPDVPCLVNPWVMTGWTPSPNAWTFNQSFAPVYQIYCSGYVAANYSPGMKVRLTHGGATKYFIVIAVADVGGWNLTIMYLYGGTDYTLAAGAITNFQYSTNKAPLCFPASPAKWTERVTDVANRSQVPVTGTWYNLGGVHIHIPYGVWRVRYQLHVQVNTAAAKTIAGIQTTLSTANNSQSDSGFSTYTVLAGASATLIIGVAVHKEKLLAQTASETPVVYYLNTSAGQPAAGIYNNNDVIPLVIEAECAYL